MSNCLLAGGASTQSRAQRPLPPGAVSAQVISARGVREWVAFTMADGSIQERELLSWVGGQSGLLWGFSSYRYQRHESHGDYGHRYEHKLADALGEALGNCFTSGRLATRFFANGSDACSAAVRLARAETGRDAIATQGYHGAHTDFGHEPHWTGYPYENVRLHRQFEFGDVVGMRQAARHAACIMVEVPAWDDEAVIAAFMRACREAADEYGIPFIVDEVVTGFRLALGGACERYGVRADLACYGKAMSACGGIAAVVGDEALVGRLNTDVFYSTTFGGEPGRARNSACTINWLREHAADVYGPAGHLQTIGQALKDGFNQRGVACVGQTERSIFQFPTDFEWRRFCDLMIAENVMCHRPNFPTLAHGMRDVTVTLDAVEKVISNVQV